MNWGLVNLKLFGVSDIETKSTFLLRSAFSYMACPLTCSSLTYLSKPEILYFDPELKLKDAILKTVEILKSVYLS